MKQFQKVLAGIGSIAVLLQAGAAFPAVPQITASAAAAESMQLRVFSYNFGSFSALYDTVGKCWYDTEGNLLSAESAAKQQARFDGNDVTVDLENKTVTDSKGKELPALTQCIEDYLSHNKGWVSYEAKYYDKAQQKYVTVPKPAGFPLTYQFRKDDDSFACDLYFGSHLYCTLAYHQQGYAYGAAVRGERATADTLPFTDAGDATVDGDVNVCDAVLTCRTVAEDPDVPITALGRELADSNSDGRVDKDDSLQVLYRLAGIEPSIQDFPDQIETWCETQQPGSNSLTYLLMRQNAEESGNQLSSGAAYTGAFVKNAESERYDEPLDAISFYYRAPNDLPAGEYCIKRAEFDPKTKTVRMFIGARETSVTDVEPDVRRFLLLIPAGKYDFTNWNFQLETEKTSYDEITQLSSNHTVMLTKVQAENKQSAEILRMTQEDLPYNAPDLHNYWSMIQNGGQFELYDLVRGDETDTLNLAYVKESTADDGIRIRRIEMDDYGALTVYASKMKRTGTDDETTYYGVHTASIELKHGALPEPSGVHYVFEDMDGGSDPAAISFVKQSPYRQFALYAKTTEDDFVKDEEIRKEMQAAGESCRGFWCNAHAQTEDPALLALRSQYRDSASVYLLHSCTEHYAITGAQMDHAAKKLTLTVGCYNDQSGLSSQEPVFSRLTLDLPQHELTAGDLTIETQFVNYGDDAAAFDAANRGYVIIENGKMLTDGVSNTKIPCKVTQEFEEFPAPGTITPDYPNVWQVRDENEYRAYCDAFHLEEDTATLELLGTKDLLFVRTEDYPCGRSRLSSINVSYDGVLDMNFANWSYRDVAYELALPSVYTVETPKGKMPTVGSLKIGHANYLDDYNSETDPEHLRFVLNHWETVDSLTCTEPVVPKNWLIGDTAVTGTQMYYESDLKLNKDALAYVLTDPAEIKEQLRLCGEDGNWDTDHCDMLVLSAANMKKGAMTAVKSAKIDCQTNVLDVDLITFGQQSETCTGTFCLLIEKDKLPDFYSVNLKTEEATDSYYEVQSAKNTKLTIKAVPDYHQAHASAEVLTGAPVSRTLDAKYDNSVQWFYDKDKIAAVFQESGWDSDALNSVDPANCQILLVNVPNTYSKINLQKVSYDDEHQLYLKVSGVGSAEQHVTQFCLVLPTSAQCTSGCKAIIASEINCGNDDWILDYRMNMTRHLVYSELSSGLMDAQAGWYEDALSSADGTEPSYEFISCDGLKEDGSDARAKQIMEKAGMEIPEDPVDLLVISIPVPHGSNLAGVQNLFLLGSTYGAETLRANIGIYSGPVQPAVESVIKVVVQLHSGMSEEISRVEIAPTFYRGEFSDGGEEAQKAFEESLPEQLNLTEIREWVYSEPQVG